MWYLISYLWLSFLPALSLSPDPEPDYVLVWSDEFNGEGLPDSTVWTAEVGDGCPNNCGWGNREVQYYTRKRLKNARMEGGKLVIEVHRESYRGKNFTSARLISQGKASWTYGRFEFRAKLPAGAGTWPALWLLGENISEVGWPACGEIDVMEHVGKEPGIVHGSIHTPSSHGATENTGTTRVPGFDSAFHLYRADWTPDSIAFFVDDRHYYTYRPEIKNSSTWPFDKPAFLIMNIAMGGHFGSDPDLETDGSKNGIDPQLESARMEVDYVRVYQQP